MPGWRGDVPLEREPLEHERDRSDFFWLDLHRPSDAELELLGEVFRFHPLAIEDSRHFGQRPKLEQYDDFVFVVVYGWAPDEDGLVEVHCYYFERFLVTVHRDEAPALASLRSHCERALARVGEGAVVLHHVVDALVDSFFRSSSASASGSSCSRTRCSRARATGRWRRSSGCGAGRRPCGR